MNYSKHVIIVLAVVVSLQTSHLAWGDFTNGGFEPGDDDPFLTAGNVNVVEYEYVNDFMGLSQPPDTTGPDGTLAWRPTGGNYFLSMKNTTDWTLMQFQFQDRPTGDPLYFSFDWFFDFGGLKPDDAGRCDVEVQVQLTARWGLMGMDFGSRRLITINESGPVNVVCSYFLDSDENLGWSRLLLPLSDLSDEAPFMDPYYNIGYVLEVRMYGSSLSESIFGIDNITLGPAGVIPLPGVFILGSLGIGFAGLKLQRRKEL